MFSNAAHCKESILTKTGSLSTHFCNFLYLLQSYATTYGPEQSNQDLEGSDVHVFTSRAHLLGQEELDDVQKALRKEITIFERREKLLGNFKVNNVIQFSQLLSIFTSFMLTSLLVLKF